MILAAGQGTRVRPLSKSLPKPMIPILGKPVMEYLIEHLASFDIREIMVNVSHHHERIENYFGLFVVFIRWTSGLLKQAPGHWHRGTMAYPGC